MTTLLGIALPLALLSPPAALQASSEAAATSPDGSRFGPPLVVNGRRITDEEFRRHFVIGIGANQLEKKKYDLFLQDEIAQRVAQGADPESFAVDEAAVQQSIDFQRYEFAKRYPSLDFDIETERMFLSMELYREQIRQQQLFDALFLPDDPADWPMITLEALRASGGEMFIDDAVRDYERRVELQERDGLDDVPPPSPVWKDVWRSLVLESINKYINSSSNPDELPEGVVAMCEGKPIRLDEVFAEIEHVISEDHLRKARTWLAMMTAVEQELEREEVLLSYTDYVDQWVPEERRFHEHLFVYQMLATQGLGYPSVYLFIEQQRLEQSYKRLLQREVDYEAELKESLQKTNWITGLAEVNAEMILISAFDFRNNRWKPDGWANAEKRAWQIRGRLEQEDGRNWSDVLDRYSEFYDPPMPEDGSTPELYLLNEGRFGPQSRNNLMGCVNESQYTQLTTGNSIADYVFFDQPVGTWKGPFPGMRGYYLTKVLSRSPVVRPLSLEHPKHRETAEIYYLRFAFNEYAHEVLARSEFEGWDPPVRVDYDAEPAAPPGFAEPEKDEG